MNKFTLPKKTTLTNVGNSLLKFFGVTPFHDTFEPLDKILKKSKKKKICLVLFDALGKYIIEKHKDVIPYIYSRKHIEFNSVYPPTTVCATTTLTTAKYPIETGYLGWNQYFEKYDDFCDTFSMRSKIYPNTFHPEAREEIFPITYIWELMNKEANEEIATFTQSFQTFDPSLSEEENLKNHFKKTNQLLKNHKFVYSYCTEPDHSMHELGTNDQKIKDILSILDFELKRLVNMNLDTLFVLVADHGMVDIEQYFYNDNKEFLATLEKPYVTIEGRFATFFVKNKEKFIEFYNKNLKDNFSIKTKEEIIKEHTFGYGTPNKYFETFFGNYFLLAKGNLSINDGLGPSKDDFKGNHAGITKKETKLYMTIFNDKI